MDKSIAFLLARIFLLVEMQGNLQKMTESERTDVFMQILWTVLSAEPSVAERKKS